MAYHKGRFLGPHYFSFIYINDISNSSDAFKFRLFADDTNLFKSLKSNIIHTSSINDELQRVSEWCSANKLTINKEKTQYMIIKSIPRNVHIVGDVIVQNSPIEGAPSINFLGVMIDQHVNWKNHINNIMKKVAPKIGIISRIRHFLPKRTLVMIYNSLILPHLIYCIEIWGNTFSSILKPLVTLQKKLVRLITFSNYRAHTPPLFRSLKILNVNQLCVLYSSLLIFDLKNNIFARQSNDYFKPLPHHYSTRQATKDNIYVQRTKLSLCQHNVKYAAVKHWNSLPRHIREIKSRGHFKSALKAYLTDE